MRITYMLWICLSITSLLSLSAFTFVAAQEDDADELLDLLEQMAAGEDVEDTVAADTPLVDDTSGEAEHQAAENILDDLEDEQWGWAGPEQIVADSIESDHIIIKTTQITYDDAPVAAYKIYYSDRTLATFQDYDKIQDMVVSPERTEWNIVYLRLSWLSPEQTYYVVVAPVHPTDPTVEPLTMISDEITFTTKKQAVSTTEKVFNNVSYTYKDGMVNLTWAGSNDAEQAEIHLRHQSEGAYTKIGTSKMSGGSFNFSVDKSGNYFLKMIAMNGEGEVVGKEHIQTVKIEEVEVPTENVIETAPKVGPASDMLIGLLVFAMMIYFVYRFRRIER